MWNDDATQGTSCPSLSLQVARAGLGTPSAREGLSAFIAPQWAAVLCPTRGSQALASLSEAFCTAGFVVRFIPDPHHSNQTHVEITLPDGWFLRPKESGSCAGAFEILDAEGVQQVTIYNGERTGDFEMLIAPSLLPKL